MAKLNQDAVLSELISIKRLLVLQLYAAGVPSTEIDKAVKMGPANIRAMFSKKQAHLSVHVIHDRA